MLLPRVLTAVVGIPFILYVVHLGGVPFMAFVVGAAVLALYEYAMVLYLGGRGVQRFLTVAGGGLVALCVALSPRMAVPIGLVPISLTLVILAAILSELLRTRHSLDRAALTVLGTLFVGWTLGHLSLIRDISPHGKGLTYMLLIAVWVTDSFAYFGGRAVGRRKLAKVVSPKKTWEGAIAGAAGALIAVLLCHRFMLPELPLPAALASGLLVGVVGQVSDLSQSMVKRASGIKDSGSLLPGHGGVFDRMDSFLLLAPLYYYLWVLI